MSLRQVCSAIPLLAMGDPSVCLCQGGIIAHRANILCARWYNSCLALQQDSILSAVVDGNCAELTYFWFQDLVSKWHHLETPLSFARTNHRFLQTKAARPLAKAHTHLSTLYSHHRNASRLGQISFIPVCTCLNAGWQLLLTLPKEASTTTTQRAPCRDSSTSASGQPGLDLSVELFPPLFDADCLPLTCR